MSRKYFWIALVIGPIGLLMILRAILYFPDSTTTSSQNPRSKITSNSKAKIHSVQPAARIVKGTVPRNSNLQNLLLGQNLTTQVVHELIQQSRNIYNLNRIRTGNNYTIEISNTGKLESFRYEINDEEYLLSKRNGDRFDVDRYKYEFDVKTEKLSTQIQGSLWETLLKLGEKTKLVMELSWILQWDVDFTTIQSGDRLRLIVDKKYRNGKLIKYGDIHAIQFTTGKKNFFAFRFVSPKSKKVKYYDAMGNSVKKAFLKVPFRFSPRVSSGFSYSRYHPILKRRRPHLGIDFAAPTGTPVLASASGRVSYSGKKGGFGNTVELRHPNGYRTSYGHLSKILVKSGQKVAQGDVIGRVGSTGLATGPHLDYRVQNPKGRYLNPRHRISWPSEKSLENRYRSEFSAVRDQLFLDLNDGTNDHQLPNLLSNNQ